MKTDIRVAEILSEYEVVLNAGSADGLSSGQEMVIYEIGPEISDPETCEPLGHLEISKGTVRITHCQEHIATARSAMTEEPRFSALDAFRKSVRDPWRRTKPLRLASPPPNRIDTDLPVVVGDRVRPVHVPKQEAAAMATDRGTPVRPVGPDDDLARTGS